MCNAFEESTLRVLDVFDPDEPKSFDVVWNSFTEDERLCLALGEGLRGYLRNIAEFGYIIAYSGTDNERRYVLSKKGIEAREYVRSLCAC